MPRYWGLRGNYDELYAWLDSLQAKECGGSVATFVSSMTRRQVAPAQETCRVSGEGLLITTKEGGKFIIGRDARLGGPAMR